MNTRPFNYWRIAFSTVTPKGRIRSGQQMLVDAPTEKEAMEIATKNLANERWSKIHACYKA